MTDMIERLARTLCLDAGDNPDSAAPAHPSSVQFWQLYMPAARHFVEAMREPTPQMVNAAWDNAPIGQFDPDAAWRHMIDAILSEKGQPR